ncbi:hypothetical protein HZH68_013959 [Vespula germanica]|uniref:Uncharacterized protein n=1 Tax=Vespula germanica TaxID=30212 RepID=A0A834JEC1_VESGE|nr:hypothetical protein HZH68_013959 [Vespula germanica]
MRTSVPASKKQRKDYTHAPANAMSNIEDVASVAVSPKTSPDLSSRRPWHEQMQVYRLAGDRVPHATGSYATSSKLAYTTELSIHRHYQVEIIKWKNPKFPQGSENQMPLIERVSLQKLSKKEKTSPEEARCLATLGYAFMPVIFSKTTLFKDQTVKNIMLNCAPLPHSHSFVAKLNDASLALK